MIKRFPLPYASLTSCYYGIMGKDFSGIPLQRPLAFKKKDVISLSKQCQWSFKHIGLTVPYYSQYISQSYTFRIFSELEVETNVKGIKHVYVEKMEIQHVMKDVFHFFIEASEHKNNQSYLLLKKDYRWLNASSIHHLTL